MTKEDLRKLRAHYQVLKRHAEDLDKNDNPYNVRSATARIIHKSFGNLVSDFPGLVEPPDINDAFQRDDFFRIETLRAQLATVLGNLEVILADEQSPAVEQRSLSFVKDIRLRAIAERDDTEIQRAFISQCWKATIILAGGMIEAILTDLLMRNQRAARTATAAPKQGDISRWDLAHLIDVALELSLVSPGVLKLSHPVREYRNLVHPGNEIRSKLSFGQEEARIALEVLNILHRDLTP